MRLVSIALAMGVHVVIARELGPSVYGAFVLALVVNGVATLLANVGTGSAVAYMIARDAVHGRAIAVSGITLVLWSGLIVTAVGWTLTVAGAIRFAGVPPVWLCAAVAVVPLRLLQEVFGGIAVGSGHWNRSIAMTLAPPFFLALALASWGAFAPLDPTAVIASWLASQVASTVFAGVTGMRSLPGTWTAGAARACVGTLIRLSVQQTVNMSAGWLMLRADRSIIGAVAGAQAVGRFTLGTALIDVALNVPSIVALAAFRGMVGLDPSAATVAFQRATRRATVTTMAIVVAMILVVGLFGGVVLGPAYTDLPTVMVALAPGAIAMAPTTLIASYFFAVQGQPGLSLRPTIAAVATMLMSVPPLTMAFGVVGAAVGTSIAQIVGAAVALLLFARRSRARWRDTVVPRTEDWPRLARVLGSATVVGRE